MKLGEIKRLYAVKKKEYYPINYDKILDRYIKVY